MSIEEKINIDLWDSIRSSYSSGNYSHAIKDAMSFITQVLRDKSGLDGDGDSLVGQALGSGKSQQPNLMINRHQTQTEKDEQRGFMFILKGLYAFIRNPRTHEQIEDSKDEADRIILFIDYLANFLGASQQSFTVQQFVSYVTDPHFVHDQEYVSSLIEQIPIRKRVDALIYVYRKRNWKQADNFRLVINELIKDFNGSELNEFLDVVSDDLQTTDKSGQVTLIIKILPNDLWPKLNKISRLRAEKMLLNDLDNAWYSHQAEETNNPSATWINQIAKYYVRKGNLRRSIIIALDDEDFERQNFIGEFFLNRRILKDIFTNEREAKNCINKIVSTLRKGNAFMKDCLIKYLQTWDADSKWNEWIIEEISDLTDKDNPEIYTPDGIPVLGKFEEKSNPSVEAQERHYEDDIPF
jgi:uncharacterized protein (TIGR02391 family)